MDGKRLWLELSRLTACPHLLATTANLVVPTTRSEKRNLTCPELIHGGFPMDARAGVPGRFDAIMLCRPGGDKAVSAFESVVKGTLSSACVLHTTDCRATNCVAS